MNLDKINSLTELFLLKYKEQQDKNRILLTSLKEPKKNYSWQQTYEAINNLTNELKNYVKKGDRCLLISENRPEWLISDFAIMLSEAITVPAYTTYAEKDYEYIINDCKPSVIFVSNMEQFRKIKILIQNKNFIRKIFSFEKLDEIDGTKYININELKSIDKKNIKELKIKEDELKKLDNEIKKTTNIISETELQIKLDDLKKKVNLYKKNQKRKSSEFSKTKNEKIEAFFIKISPIIENYMKTNNISMVVDKKNIFIADSNYDITDQIIEILNK